MLSEITSRHVLHADQCFSQYFPRKNIDSHGCQITSRLLRLLFKFIDLSVLICDDYTKSARLFPRNRHAGNRHCCVILFVIIQHHFIIHLINMVTWQNQDIFWIICINIVNVLVNGIGCAGIPVTSGASLIWWENSYSSVVTIQIPRHSDPDVCVQPQRLVLSKYTNRIDPGIDAVAQWKVNDPVLAAKGNCRFCNLCSKHAQSASLTAG